MENIVNTLIKCKKIVTKKPQSEMYEDKQHPINLRNEFECKSEDGCYKFSVFMRKSSMLDSMFSIGLRVESRLAEGEKPENIGLTLLRCNGFHYHKNSVRNTAEMNGYHIHILEDQQFLCGKDRPIDADTTVEYDTFHTALHHFLSLCNIHDRERYFPEANLLQLTLMEDDNHVD